MLDEKIWLNMHIQVQLSGPEVRAFCRKLELLVYNLSDIYGFMDAVVLTLPLRVPTQTLKTDPAHYLSSTKLSYRN